MAAITAKMVKELREKSGAGMMDCKKALTKTDGDMEKAIEFLRENGQMKAQKKADRIAAEGLCLAVVSEDEKKAVTVEVNSETDFVAKNEKFQNFVAKVAETVMATDAADVEALLAEEVEPGKNLQALLTEQIATIGENLKIRRFARVEEADGFVTTYTHMGGKIVVAVDVQTDVINDAVKEMAKNVAMHVMGRLNKELSEICLMDQVYVKAEDGKQSVQKYVDQVAKANGAKIAIKGFVRYETGEGLEKKQENFAAEVAAQMNH